MERNFRGLLPPEMNHKKINEINDAQGFDYEPDYLIVVKSNRSAFLVQ